jgi:hypothetical protein
LTSAASHAEVLKSAPTTELSGRAPWERT